MSLTQSLKFDDDEISSSSIGIFGTSKSLIADFLQMTVFKMYLHIVICKFIFNCVILLMRYEIQVCCMAFAVHLFGKLLI